MTYYVTETTKNGVIIRTLRTDCEYTADIVAEVWEEMGFDDGNIIIRRQEC